MKSKVVNFSTISRVACEGYSFFILPFPTIVPSFAIIFKLGALACGIGKEYGDSKAHGNTWSWPDLAADAAGAFVGCFAGFVALLI